MKQIPYIEWDDENKVATCLLYYKLLILDCI